METGKQSVAAGQVATLAGLINYQDGAVVSREVLRKKTGTVTVFAFDEGQGISEHTTPFDALVYVLEGEMEIVISGKPHSLTGGEIVIMPANEPHALKAIAKAKMLLIMIRS
jgi:quercetin dioxygenase-like cupin family protein